MSYTKRIICLANSKKNRGRCVAGLEVLNSGLGGWIRPVSARDTEELLQLDRFYENGQDIHLLDVVDIRFLRPKPYACQVENHLIDDTVYWTYVSRFSAAKLLAHATTKGPLWVDGYSSGYGCNDRVPIAAADRLDRSLDLVRVEDLRIRVVKTPYGPKVRAAFRLGKLSYDFVITDTEFNAQFLRSGEQDKRYPHDAVACVSLGGPLSGYRYKLVASVVDLP